MDDKIVLFIKIFQKSMEKTSRSKRWQDERKIVNLYIKFFFRIDNVNIWELHTDVLTGICLPNWSIIMKNLCFMVIFKIDVKKWDRGHSDGPYQVNEPVEEKLYRKHLQIWNTLTQNNLLPLSSDEMHAQKNY